jgi:acetyl/propionyl-CoA carboxylase alpha subunit
VIGRVLIANRGEIALRVIRACRTAGIGTVAVYSDADAAAPHVHAADTAVRIGPAPAAESYLDVGALIDAARRTGADAVHPGYGFLSERAFRQSGRRRRPRLTGPTADSITRLGSKTGARTLMEAAGVPVVPGARRSRPTPRYGRAIARRAAARETGIGRRRHRHEDGAPPRRARHRPAAGAARGAGRLRQSAPVSRAPGRPAAAH